MGEGREPPLPGPPPNTSIRLLPWLHQGDEEDGQAFSLPQFALHFAQEQECLHSVGRSHRNDQAAAFLAAKTESGHLVAHDSLNPHGLLSWDIVTYLVSAAFSPDGAAGAIGAGGGAGVAAGRPAASADTHSSWLIMGRR